MNLIFQRSGSFGCSQGVVMIWGMAMGVNS